MAEFFFGPLRKTFLLKRDTFYVTLLLLFRGNNQAGDREQNGAEEREQESHSLNYDLTLGR